MFTLKSQKRSDDDISSPSDWPSSFTELNEIDNLLRCGICYDFLQTAMGIRDCSHTFCSLCIRQYFSYQNKCPVCYGNSVESDLQNNRVLDEVVQKFVSIRSKLLGQLQNKKGNDQTPSSSNSYNLMKLSNKPNLRNLSQKEDDVSSGKKIQMSSTQKPCQQSPRKMEHCFKRKNPHVSPRKAKRRKTRENNEDDDDSILITSTESDSEDELASTESPPKHLPVSKANTKSSSKHLRVSKIADSSLATRCSSVTVEDDEIRIVTPVTAQSDESNSYVSLIGQSDDTGSNASVVIQSNDKTDKATVPCPVCGVGIRKQLINIHLDSCLIGSDKKSALRRTVPKRKPMAKLVYNLLSERDLRKKLKEVGLSTKGDKKEMIRRHHDLVLRYNAECDSLNPKSDIVKEIERHETAKTSGASKPSKKMVVDKGSSPNTVRQAQKNYEKIHQKQFNDLIKSAKERMHSSKKIIVNETENDAAADELGKKTTKQSKSSNKVTINNFETIDIIESDTNSESSTVRRSLRRSLRKSTPLLNEEKLLHSRGKNVGNLNSISQKIPQIQKETGKKSQKVREDSQDGDVNKKDISVSDCSKCLDTRKDISPCKIHKNKVHIQVEVHTSPPATTRELLSEFTEPELEKEICPKKAETGNIESSLLPRKSRLSTAKTRKFQSAKHATELSDEDSSCKSELKSSKDDICHILKSPVQISKTCSPRKSNLGNTQKDETCEPESKDKAIEVEAAGNTKLITPAKHKITNSPTMSGNLSENKHVANSPKKLSHVNSPRSEPSIDETHTTSSTGFTNIKSKSPRKQGNERVKTPEKDLLKVKPIQLLSPRSAGISCSPVRFQKSGTPSKRSSLMFVQDSESETEFDDSLIRNVTSAIDKFGSDSLLSDLNSTWPALSRRLSDSKEQVIDDENAADSDSNESFGSDISHVVPETGPMKLQRTGFPTRRSGRAQIKEDKSARLRRSKHRYSTTNKSTSRSRRTN